MPTFIYIDVAIWTCIHRLTARGRKGDNPDAIARKFASFAEKTQPMIDILEDGGALTHLDADGWTIDMLAEAIETRL